MHLVTMFIGFVFATAAFADCPVLSGRYLCNWGGSWEVDISQTLVRGITTYKIVRSWEHGSNTTVLVADGKIYEGADDQHRRKDKSFCDKQTFFNEFNVEFHAYDLNGTLSFFLDNNSNLVKHEIGSFIEDGLELPYENTKRCTRKR